MSSKVHVFNRVFGTHKNHEHAAICSSNLIVLVNVGVNGKVAAAQLLI